MLVCLGPTELSVRALRRALREGGAAAGAAAAAVPASRRAPGAPGFSCGSAALSRDTTCRDCVCAEPNALGAVLCVLTLFQGLPLRYPQGSSPQRHLTLRLGQGPKPERHYAPASKGPCNRLELVGVPTPHAGPYCESQHNTQHITPNRKILAKSVIQGYV